jgi:hypothetical protein
MTIADANAHAEEHCTAHNRHKGKKKETLEVSGSTNGTNTGSEMECTAGAVRAWAWRSNDRGAMEQGFSRTLNIGRVHPNFVLEQKLEQSVNARSISEFRHQLGCGGATME